MNNEINDNINRLNYDPNQILSFQGKAVESITPAHGEKKGTSYIVVTKEKCPLSSKNFDIAVVDSINDRTYPGALLLANRKLIENMPTSLQVKRAPLTLGINLPGMTKDGVATVEEPSYSSVKIAINTMLKSWLERYSEKYHTPANCSYSEIQAYSMDQLAIKLGCNMNLLQTKLGIDFESISRGEKSVFVIVFKQIFYTVAIDGPESPAALFADDVTWKMIADQGVNDENPPAYVANVAYGRTIYVALETESHNQNIEAQIKLAIKDNDLNANVMKQKIFENCKYTAIVIGGDATSHVPVVTKDFGEIQKVILDNSLFSATNPGAPISYTAVFLKHNELATVNSTTEYVRTVSTEYPSSKVTLIHTGGYIAKFYVDWQEYKYEEDGTKVFTDKSWNGNGKELSAPFTTEISLPGNTTNIHIRAEEYTGLVWEKWRTVIDQAVPTVPLITASIWGTTLNQKGKIDLG